MRRLIRRPGFRFATSHGDGSHCCAADDASLMCAECRKVVAQPKMLVREEVPPPTDMAARIRAAAQPSPLKDLMLAGISYDHM